MAGTREGALKAKAANLAKDPDYYTKLGKIGGKASKAGGFASSKVGSDGLTGPQRARVAGSKSIKTDTTKP